MDIALQDDPHVNAPTKLLSLVVTGRNDDYMGNFRWRLETSLNYLAENLLALRKLDCVEVIAVDWGSEVPLHAVLALSSTARQIVRFVQVPPQLAKALQGDSNFPGVLALNTGIRRAQAQFVAITNTDILFPQRFLSVLLNVLAGQRDIGKRPDRAFILGRQRQLPWTYVSQQPDIHEMDWLIGRCGRLIRVESCPVDFGATGMQLMHRLLWEECTGYDERLIYWGWNDIDLGLRVTRKYPRFDLTKLGVTLFHLEHYNRGIRSATIHKANLQRYDNAFAPNADTWGLKNENITEFTYSPHVFADLPAEQERPAQVRMNPLLRATLARILVESVSGRIKHALVGCLAPVRRRLGAAFYAIIGRPRSPSGRESAPVS